MGLFGGGKPRKQLRDTNLNANVSVKKAKTKKQKQQEEQILRYVQDTIPYESVFEDGIFVNKQGEYSKVYPLLDVNFKIESPDVQANIYMDYQDLFNTFSSDTHLQISLVNRYLDKEKFHDIIFTKMRGDELDPLRQEFNEILESKEKVGDNEIVKNRYITVSVTADGIDAARLKFSQLDKNIRKAVEKINHVQPAPLTTMERLEMLYDFYNAGQESDFLMAYRNEVEMNDINKFDIRKLAEYGLTTKDAIAPSYFEFAADKMMIGERYAQALCVKDFPTSLNTDFLVELNNVHCSMITSVHYEIIDRDVAAKKTATLQTTINSEVIDAQKQAMKNGYDPELIPQRIKYDRDSIQEIRDAIQKDNQKLIKTCIIIVHTADTLEQLAQQEAEIKSIGRTKMVNIITLRQQQERALNSVLPLGHNDILIFKTLTTRAAAILVPFELQEMTQKNGFYYGLNTVSNRLLLFNRKSGDNYNALILGRSGSGKSFKAKEEILSSVLGTNDDVIILDPQGEYTPFVKALGGEAINFSAGCGTHINPFDMDLSYADDEESGEHTNPLVLKNSYIGSICEIAVGGRFGLTQGQKSIIDRVISIIYAKFMETGSQEDIPTMIDFYEALKRQPEAEAISIARPLEQFAVGSLDLFAHKTNVVLTNRLTCYNIKALTNPALKDMALVACLNDIWNRTLENRKKGKFTWIYMDEFHLFLKSDAVLDFLMSIWKRARKFGGGPTGITQNISDLLKSQAAETIFSNSSLIVMLNQAPGDRAALARLLNISETQQQYINNARKGSGLIWTGHAIIPFMDEFPQNTRLYQMMSTNATEAQQAHGKKAATPAPGSIMEEVTQERLSRPRQEPTEQQRLDDEYEDEMRHNSGAPVVPVAPVASDEPVFEDIDDDFDDDGFGLDPFAASTSSSSVNSTFAAMEDEEEDDEDFPDEFDTNFGGGNSMFNVRAPQTPSAPPTAPKAPTTPPAPPTAPRAPQTPPTAPSAPKSGDKNKDAINSFFNF